MPESRRRKRGQNDGSVTQRKDGTWQAALSTPQGRKYFYGKSKGDAWAKLVDARKELDAGRPLPSGKLSVGAYLDQWLADVVRPHRAYRTWTGHESHIRIHLKPALGATRLDKLTAPDVQRLLNRLVAAGRSPRTVESVRDTLAQALQQAVAWNLVGQNVAEATVLPRPDPREPPALTADQARALLDAVAGDRLEALYLVTTVLGLRQGEALGLRWRDVELDAGLLHVQTALQRQKQADGAKAWVFKPPKTKRSRRSLPLPAPLVAALRAHRTAQKAERLRAGPDWEDWDLVFCTRHGKPLAGSDVTHRFQRLLAGAGLPHLRYHDLRHACASVATALGLPDRIVMELLGHTQVGMTAKYQHIPSAVLRAATEELSRALVGDRERAADAG